MPATRKSLVDFFSRALTTFQSSPDPFAVLCTLPHHGAPDPAPRPATHPVSSLIVLDSSFNPPTTAHAQMARSAVQAARAAAGSPDGVRLMLLLAVRNADKAPKPASFPLRLGMMEGFGRGLVEELGHGLQVDLAVTTRALFYDKARAVAQTEFYQADDVEEPEQAFLVGFDTLTRILDAKYYDVEDGGMEKALGPFFERARLRVTVRPDEAWGGREEQEQKVRRLADGELEAVGGDGRWVSEKVDLVEGGGDGVSSSKVREMVKDGSMADVESMVGAEVKEWIEEEGLYTD